MRRFLRLLLLLVAPGLVWAQTFDPPRFDIGQPVLSNLWVNPVTGSDAASGTASNQALRTLAEAWARIPQGVTLTNYGYRIYLLPGDYAESALPVYWESRHGSLQAPVVVQAHSGPGTVRLHGYLNIYNCRYLYLLDFNAVTDPGYGGGGDVLHLAECRHVLVRGVTLNGFDGAVNQPQETVKANQCQYLYFEECDIGGAEQNAVDFVAVQYGHVVNCRIHDAEDWVMYVKGGSAQLRIEGNEFYRGRVGGFTAGQGTGFEYMVNPWLHHEASDIKFINNVIHHTAIAGFGVNGGYNILFAYNTLYRVGTNDHLFEAMPGGRSCDGDLAACQSNRNAGGWGAASGADGDYIPNRNVYVYNNVFYNPPGVFQGWQHFNIGAAVTPPAPTGMPGPSAADQNLQIRGNLIWSGNVSTPLGVEDCETCGCQAGNPTCNEAQLLADNTINTVHPQLRNPEAGDYRPTITGALWGVTTYAIPEFPGGDRPTPPLAPTGLLSNTVPRERAGASRDGVTRPPGAYTGGSSLRLNVAPDPAGVRIRLIAESNYTYRVEAGSHLASWSALFTTNTVGATTDVVEASVPDVRLYRAVLVQ